ncbi:AfsR/SARP family transcriptional regulator [Arthrobacter sp. TMN-50]
MTQSVDFAVSRPIVDEPTVIPCRLTIQIIGSLIVRRGDTVLNARQLGGPKPRQILELLLLQVGHPVSKDRLIERLWGGNSPAEPLATLESYISVLRRNIQPGAGKAGPLRTVGGGYVMDRELVDLDLDLFASRLKAAHRCTDPAGAYELLCTALSLNHAPLFGDELRPAWADEERALHAARVAEACVLAAEAAAFLGRAAESVTWAKQALSADLLNERVWTALILGLEQNAQFAEGLQCYEQCRQTFARELGCAPASVLQDAYARLLRATASGEDELGPLLSAILVLHRQLSDRLETNTLGTVQSTPSVRSALMDARNIRDAREIITSFLIRATPTA